MLGCLCCKCCVQEIDLWIYGYGGYGFISDDYNIMTTNSDVYSDDISGFVMFLISSC